MPDTADRINFLQAEDGIRDLTVTGVQTCALPISPLARPPRTPTGGDQQARGDETTEGSGRFRLLIADCRLPITLEIHVRVVRWRANCAATATSGTECREAFSSSWCKSFSPSRPTAHSVVTLSQ